MSDFLKHLIDLEKVFVVGSMIDPDLQLATEIQTVLERTGEKPIVFAISKNSGTADWNKNIEKIFETPHTLVVCVNGKLYGGLDKLKEAEDNGELVTILKEVKKVDVVEDKYEEMGDMFGD